MEKVRWPVLAGLGLLLGATLPRQPAGSAGHTDLRPAPAAPWNIARIKAPQAWAITQGSPEIVVAVIDSGIDFSLPELAGVRWTNPREAPNGRDDDENGYVDDLYGWDFRDHVPAHRRRTPLHYHGTAVASVLAARARDLVGVAPQIRLMDLRFLDSRGLFYERDWRNLARAIDYAVQNGAHIINLSLVAMAPPPREVEEALARAGAQGVLVVAIAGNAGREGVNPLARYPFVLAVAATDRDDCPARFSNRGPEVDLSAPGAEIPALLPQGAVGTLSGTSFAAPHVSGTLALVLSANPGLSGPAAGEVLLRTCEAWPQERPGFGRGLVDAAAAVAAARNLPAPARPAKLENVAKTWDR